MRTAVIAGSITILLVLGLVTFVAAPRFQGPSTGLNRAVSVNLFNLSRTGPMALFLDVAHSPQNASVRPGETFSLNLTLAFPKTSDEGDTSTNATALVVTVSLSTPNFALLRLSYQGLNDNLARVVVNADSGVQLQALVKAPTSSYAGPLSIDFNVNRFP